jgi:membrane-associated HD superfamily phosphohydrolase
MIIMHVKNGINYSQHRIPQNIDFIPMHHEQSDLLLSESLPGRGRGRTVHDYIYRYPGPSRTAKKQAWCLDAVEASTSVGAEDPTPKDRDSD